MSRRSPLSHLLGAWVIAAFVRINADFPEQELLMSNLLLTTLPARPTPLIVRQEGNEKTIQHAAGFGLGKAAEAAERIAAAAEKAAQDMYRQFAASASVPTSRTGSTAGTDPFGLRQPDMARLSDAAGPGSEKLTPEAMLTLIFGRLQQCLQASGLEGLKQRLASYQARMAVRAEQNNQLSAGLEAALKAAEAAGEHADAVAGEVGAQQGAVEAAREEVATLRKELDGMEPDDPARAGKQAELDAAQQRLVRAETGLEQATQKLAAAGQAFNAALLRVEVHRSEMDGIHAVGTATPKPSETELSAAARLQQLIAMLSELSADVALEKLKSETEALMAALKAREAENLERSRKHEEEQQRARDAEKKTGCAGKILGWVSAVASVAVLVIGAVTFNPAMIAVGVVGMLYTIDSMSGAAGGFSVVGKFTEVLGNAIKDALVGLGVGEQLAETIGRIAATVVVVVVFVLANIAAGNIGGALQSMMAVQSIGRAADIARQVAEVVQVIGQLLSVAGAVTQGVGQIIVAGIMIDVAKLLAAIEESLFGSDVMRELLNRIRDAAAVLDRSALDLLKKMASVNQENTDTALTVLSHIRGHA